MHHMDLVLTTVALGSSPTHGLNDSVFFKKNDNLNKINKKYNFNLS